MKKGQMVMNFLTTYGLAILVVLVVFGALFFLGVFKLPEPLEKFNPELHDCTEWEKAPFLYSPDPVGLSEQPLCDKREIVEIVGENRSYGFGETCERCVSWQPKRCFREVINTKWIDACCIKSNQTLMFNQAYKINVELSIDEDFDLLLQSRIRTNFTSEINITTPNQMRFGNAPAICIDGLNTSETKGVSIDEQWIDATKCTSTPKVIRAQVKCKPKVKD